MKRDIDLIRKILEEVEIFPHYGREISISSDNSVPLNIEGYDHEIIDYHVKLLCEARLLERFPGNYYPYSIMGLTWEGHEFLDLMKQDSVWNRAKSAMKETGGMAFEVLLKVLVETATKTALGQL